MSVHQKSTTNNLSKSQIEKIKIKKRPHIFFLRSEADFFGFKTFPPMALNFCKVGLPDKVTGL